jgi:hypothetical protein
MDKIHQYARVQIDEQNPPILLKYRDLLNQIGVNIQYKCSESRDRSTAGDHDPVRIEARAVESNRRCPGFEWWRLCCRVVCRVRGGLRHVALHSGVIARGLR